jgi:hypothetical protein
VRWDGPVNADQSMRLIIAPRWLVTLLRFAEVAFLLLFTAVIAATILGRRWNLPGGLTLGANKAAGIVALGVLGLLVTASPATEAQTPHPELLRELETRLLQPPDCVPRCAEIASATVDIGADSVTVEMNVHALEEVALPLPGSLQGWRPAGVRVDGSGASRVLRGQDQLLWLHVNEGRHEVVLSGPVLAVDNLEIPFPTPPRFIEARSDHWSVAGIKDRRLLSGSLQLTRLQTDQGDEAVRWESGRFPAFVRIERVVDLDLDWQATTSVRRIAPAEGALTLDIPVLEGESVVSENFTVEDGRILVTMTPEQNTVSWRSNLPRKSPLILTAAVGRPWKEVWRVGVGSVWRAEFSGVPESETGFDAADVRVAEFHNTSRSQRGLDPRVRFRDVRQSTWSSQSRCGSCPRVPQHARLATRHAVSGDGRSDGSQGRRRHTAAARGKRTADDPHRAG